MTGNENDQLAVPSNEESPHDLMSEIQKLRSEMLEKLDKLTTESEENKKTHKQEHVLEKLQSIERLVSRNQPENELETINSDSPIGLSLKNPTAKTPEIAKSFVLKHVFNDVDKFEDCEGYTSEMEEHFGVKWCIFLNHDDNHLGFYLDVEHPGEDWEIDTSSNLKVIGPEGTEFSELSEYCFKESTGWGEEEFLKWEELVKNYLVGGYLTAVIEVKIIETKGLRKEKFRNFDESVKDVSDIVLVVKDRKFHVHKTYLAAQSSFFKALLLGNFAESKKSEVTLTGIDSEDFHFFLEVLYGEAAIDDITVEGIVMLADMYDAPTAIRRCEEFMLKESKKTLKKKLQMADRYSLDALKNKCLSEIKTLSDVRSVVPNNVQDLEHSTIASLLKKAISVKEL